MSDPFVLNVLGEIAKQGIVGIIAVLFIVFYRRERLKVDITQSEKTDLAKAFNKQIAALNEQRAEEIRVMAEALKSTSDANYAVANSMERLRDFVIEQKLKGATNEEAGS